MWFFNSPKVVFGPEAVSWLAQLDGHKAFIVTDEIIAGLGFLDTVRDQLNAAGIQSAYFDQVEPDPSITTVKRCAAEMAAFVPDWIVGLGGGSALDAAKAAWFLYECPDIELETINPMQEFGLRSKARFITIPTTAGSGAEVTAAAVIMDDRDQRKIEIASYEVIPDLAIIDPAFTAHLPAQLTADSGIDVLTHAVEGYASTFYNDFSDALCIHAARMVFEYLPRCVLYGDSDSTAREKMANAAALAGLGMGNSHIALAHALGHSAGAVFHLPHGRITGLFLPYTIEFTANGGVGRYQGLSQSLGLAADNEHQAALSLAEAVRGLIRRLGLPLSLQEAGIQGEHFQQKLGQVLDRAEIDSALGTCLRLPYRDELEKMCRYAFDCRQIDF